MLCKNVPNSHTRKKELEWVCLSWIPDILVKTPRSAKVHMYQQIKKDSWLSAGWKTKTNPQGRYTNPNLIWKRESCDSDSNILECTLTPVGGWKFCSPFLVRVHLRGYCSQTFHAHSVFMDGDLRLWSWTESVEQKPLDPIDVYIFYPPNKWEKPNKLEVGPWTFDLAMVQIARILANRSTNPQGSHVCFSVKSCHMEHHRNLGNLNVEGDTNNLENKNI